MKKYIKLRQTHFTLLETLVAFALLAMILTFVFSFFRELSILSRSSDNNTKESFNTRYTEARLSYIFQRVSNENDTKKKYFFFYTQDTQTFSNMPSLIFTFDNEVRADPTFSDCLLARLYVDNEHCLRLASWSIYVTQPHQSMHEEILLENVADIHFSFYTPPHRGIVKDSNDNKPQPEPDKWPSEWLKDYKQMPVILQLKITVAKNREALKKQSLTDAEKEELIFKFVLPSSKHPIEYPIV